MRIPEKSSSLARFNSLKSTLAAAADKPSNEALFQKQGDRLELTQNVQFSLDGEKVVVKKGSAFDNDIRTPDKIMAETTNGSTVQSDSYEHFSERRGLIFKRDVEMLKVTLADQEGFNSSFNSLTFEV